MGDERAVLISANWNMHLNHVAALGLAQQLPGHLRASAISAGREVSIHPPFPSLATVKATIVVDRVPVALGAQSCHFADAGAYTGEVSAGMLATLKVRYVIAGHSERRRAIRPILSVSETAHERHSGVADKKVRRQMNAALGGRRAELVVAAVVAYEPIWAIGAGATATPDEEEEMCRVIREELEQLAGAEAAAMVRIQYGDSVMAETSEVLLSTENMDGFLVGGASLDAEQFAAIVIG